MALTLVQAVADVRQLLNEPTAVFWTDAQLEDWIKEGTRIIAAKTLAVEADDDITLVTNQLVYTTANGDGAWIDNCLEQYAAIYNNGSNKYKGLQFIHPKQIGNLMTYTAGEPRYYSFHNRSFYIWPLPSSTYNGNTVNVLYSTETEDVTALQDEFQHLAILWAFAKAKEKDMKFAEAGALKGQFFQELQFVRSDKTLRAPESTAVVKTGAPEPRGR
jgi:hypothetical protein